MAKTWFITGASSGLGRSMAEVLLARGDRVAATVRRPGALSDLSARHGDDLWVGMLDLTDTSTIRYTVDAAWAALDRIDVVVNNAGYGLFAAAEEASDEQVRHQIDTNLVGSIQVIRAALPHLRAQRGGQILQVSSAGGQFAFPSFSLYHATKWGIEGFCEAVAKEVAPFGIGVTIVEPGATRTRFGDAMASAPALPAYAGTPAHEVQVAVANGAFPIPGDPAKMVRAIIDCADGGDRPLRLPLGSDTYGLVQGVLAERLAALEAAREIAHTTDCTP